MGNWGVPFMKSTTSLEVTSFLMVSWMLMVRSFLVRGQGAPLRICDRPCEERGDEAIQRRGAEGLDCLASLAMTVVGLTLAALTWSAQARAARRPCCP